jgi:molecular chaperone DnaK (HSP70)
MVDPIVGIDLGTTNSLVAFCDEAGPRVLALGGEECDIMPSVVRYGSAGVEAVGHSAREGAVDHPEATIHSVKRLMGRGAKDPVLAAARLPYRVVAGPRGLASVEVAGNVRTPQEISAAILAALAERAAKALGHRIVQAVVTVPAYFDDAQRQATRDAGRLAGLDIRRVINEPTAAALAYGIGSRAAAAERVAVYDFGGGTFDITILEVLPPDDAQEVTESIFRVLATAGDTHLGGDDLDWAIVEAWVGDRAVEAPPSARQALRRAAEAAKIELSTAELVQVAIDLPAGLDRLEESLSREAFDAMAMPFVERTLGHCAAVLKDAGLSVGALDRVVLVGGTTRLPIVRRMVEAFFGMPPYTALDPERVVALGAAVQGAILAGVRSDMLLLDVVPLSLGIETVGGAMAKLVMRNATIPARAVEMFSTSVDGQVNVAIHVLQGEREMAADCRSLARFEVRGIPPMPAGIPQLEVEFTVDANGVLGVRAVERRSGRRADVQVIPSFGLRAEDVARIEAESFAHARQDMALHRIVDLAVNAALDVKWIAAALARVRGQMAPAIIAEVEAASAEVERFIREAQRAPGDVDGDAFHAAKEALDRASVPVHERAITQSLTGGSSPPPGT